MDPVRNDRNIRDMLKELAEFDLLASITVKERILHVGVLPHEKEDLNVAIRKIISYKLGVYDSVLGGILLDILSISILNEAAIIGDGPACHIDIKAKFLIYQPKITGLAYVEIKKVLVPGREYQAELLKVCEVVVKFTSPIWLQEGSSVPFAIVDFNFDCEKPFFICRPLGNNSSIDN